MAWEDKKEVKKGNIGEDIIQEYLESKGWVIYRPKTSAAHWFDMLACHNKKHVIALDVKTKARFNYRACQGINKTTCAEYVNFLDASNIPFFLFFIDDKDGSVYKAEFSKLKGKGFTPTKTPHIIAWDLSDMEYLFNIGDEKIIELSMFDKRKHEYKPN